MRGRAHRQSCRLQKAHRSGTAACEGPHTGRAAAGGSRARWRAPAPPRRPPSARRRRGAGAGRARPRARATRARPAPGRAPLPRPSWCGLPPAAGEAGGSCLCLAVGGETVQNSITAHIQQERCHTCQLAGRRAACARQRERAPAAPAAHAGASAAAAASPRARCQERPAGRRAAPASAVAAMKVRAGGASTCKA